MTAVMTPRTTSKVHTRRRIVIGRRKNATEQVAEKATKIRTTVRNIWLAIVDRFRRSHAFVQYSVFFGLAFAGSAVAWMFLETAASWAILYPLWVLGFPNLAIWAASIAAVAMWIGATLVWFSKLDRWFDY